MMLARRIVCAHLLAAIAVFFSTASLAQGQPATGFPARTVRIIVAFPPGSSPDVVARSVTEDLSKAWGHPVVVENRPGAGAIIGTDTVAKAEPDGHTLYMGTMGALVLNVHLYKKLPYDPVRDFSGVTFVADAAFSLAVHPSVKAQSVGELVALAKANPGKLNYSSGASFAQLLGEAFKQRTGSAIENVSYKGVQPAISDLLAGQVQLTFADLASILPQHKAGKVRILGVTGARRSVIAPEIPTLAEQGVADYDFSTWYAFVAPSATPRPVIEKLNADVSRALNQPETRKRLAGLGLDVHPSRPEAVDALVRSEIEKWGKVVRDSGIQPQ
jgi:tripartite-type tricarboxylate transporter receptor subunit TctC